jgi:hypothetical protein
MFYRFGNEGPEQILLAHALCLFFFLPTTCLPEVWPANALCEGEALRENRDLKFSRLLKNAHLRRSLHPRPVR